MTDRYDVLIVGGGHGGAQAAITLRQRGFTGSIALVGEEPDPPYERPPLSKDYLAGYKPFERILIRNANFWVDRHVMLRLGKRVVAVDAADHRVVLEDGSAIGYGQLIWATGGAPRRLSCAGHDLAGVHCVRTRADVDRLKSELDETRHVVVIGGGYIGLEAAAVLTTLGKAVTVVEALDRVLARVAGEPLSRFYEAEHRARGVTLHLGVAVDRLEGRDDRVTGVRLADGTHLACDMVIVGIGIVPAVAPLLAAGGAGGNGVDVDECCRTTLPDVFAIGDCAAQHCRFADGARIRLESVQNATDQAMTAARAILRETPPPDAVPWFWSNQYDLKLQTIGLSRDYDETLVRGDMASRAFSLVYLRDGRVIALDCVNATKDYVQGRKLVEAGAIVPRERLADAAISLKELLPA